MSTKPDIAKVWDIAKVKEDLKTAFEKKSELMLLKILKENTFLFYELYERRYTVQPIFHEIYFAEEQKCDFAWLHDNTDGPEWVLVEIEKPRMELFTEKKDPTHFLNHGLEQVRGWRRYFNEKPAEKKRIFGAVARFKYILVAGDKSDWESESAARWRIDNNKETEFQIRSSDVFRRAIKILEERPEEMWSFAERPTTVKPSELKTYWENYKYMDYWRKIIL